MQKMIIRDYQILHFKNFLRGSFSEIMVKMVEVTLITKQVMMLLVMLEEQQTRLLHKMILKAKMSVRQCNMSLLNPV